MRWELWSTDTFDRDAAPSCEGRGDDFLAGCAGLWRTGLTAEGAARCAVLAGQRSRACVVHSDFTPRVVDFSAG